MQRKFNLAKCRASIQERMTRVEQRLQRLQLDWDGLETLSLKIKPTPLIFLGPSLNREKAQKIIEADFRAPIARGDLMKALGEGYRIFGIIDGVFHQNLTVGIEEIRYALEAGATLYGAASMGALRAAETYPLGMVGIGEIYQWYRDETVDSDDEVAVCFEKASGKSLSEPSVNLRSTLNFLAKEGKLDKDEANIILKTYLELHFTRRNLTSLSKTLLETFSAHQVQNWDFLLQSHWIDQKAVDAMDLIKLIRDKHVSNHS